MKRLILLSIMSALIAVSCTKNIHLNLQNASGLLVMEGNISDQPGPYTVLLSKTVTYYDSNAIIPVSGAHVTIADDAGNKDSLLELSPGKYFTTSIVGTVGRTYHLSVNSGGKQYDAYSTMNPPVSIDTFGLGTFFIRSNIPFIEFHDPASTTNYYKGSIYINGVKQYKVNPINDNLSNGITTLAVLSTDSGFKKHDTLVAELAAIDKPMYNYWSSLTSSTLSSQTAAPASPATNWSNNGLGYFSAYAATKSHTIVIDSFGIGYHRIN
jgi:Domain of unknown function (DUF4249)